ncbi:hypothetical protein IFR04_003798 [Cadophora malorum]|uniref:Heterokaryon incompatibility domain-containing protein n=1 Tax=Cadophora malorum TaxID=108018 RepID=A0A8H8BT56_9HELO|nr:hypothetical protein IFR04_003798 [Cadophora malorum]
MISTSRFKYLIHKVSQRDKNHKTLDPKAAAQELDRRIDHNRTSDSNAAQALGRQNIDDKAPGQEFSLCQSCSRILSAAIESLMVILYLKVMLSTRMPEHSYVIQTFAGYASRMQGKMWLHAYGLHLGELRWFAHPNSVAAALGMPPAHLKVNRDALSLLGRYAEDCFLERGKCSHLRRPNIDSSSLPPLLPRRFIDIGNLNVDPTSSLHLHESIQDERGLYTTLSHRWGSEITYKTTIENIKNRRDGIDFEELPMSFKDAISVTRALGIRYLWIDAICIVQNDHSDWMDQAPRMGKIYKDSHCTIAAHSAQKSSDGFLESESSLNPTKVVPCLSLEAGPGQICIGIPRSFKETIDCSYINQRGWVLQELTLSQRTAHFSNGYIYWDCPHTTTPRSVGCLAETSIQTSLALKIKGTGADFVESWMDLVTVYSKCELTYGTDKLAAISGIAAEWQGHLGEGGGTGYHSGLFECTLPQSLLWFSGGGSLKRIEKRAPSWSWASADGQIQFMRTKNTTVVATLKAVNDGGGDVVTANSHQCRLTLHTSVRSVSVTGRFAYFGMESCTAQFPPPTGNNGLRIPSGNSRRCGRGPSIN